MGKARGWRILFYSLPTLIARVPQYDFDRLGLRLKMASTCSYCRQLTVTGRLYHHPDVLSLIESAKQCAMCGFTVHQYDGTDGLAEATALARSGSYSKLLLVGDGVPSRLRENAAVYSAEITSKARVFSSKSFIVTTEKTPYSDRVIWMGEGQLDFDRRLPTIKQWIRECEEGHQECSLQIDSTILPTRLIDVGTADGSHPPRLVLSSDLLSSGNTTQVRYSALSHRWGTRHMPLRTLKENVNDHLQLLPIDSLPQTFRDAVLISQKLNIPYLWIDSICIIQDDPKDWQHEAAQMAAIYANAYITLAAASAEDSTEGCVPEPLAPSTRFEALDPTTPEESGGTCLAFARPLDRPSVDHDYVAHSVLSSRGWILQEMILSRRVVYLSKTDQMYWQCRSLYQSEDGTLDARGRAEAPASEPGVAMERAEREVDGPGGVSAGFLKLRAPIRTPLNEVVTWLTWMNEYSNRQLTNPSDRLPALAGLVRYFAARTGDEPLVGLWRRHAVPFLMWGISDESTRRARRKGLPSWSWLAVDAEAYTLTFDLGDLDNRAVGLWGPRLEHVSIVWVGEPYTSQLVEACLTIRGRVLPRVFQRGRRRLVPREGTKGKRFDEWLERVAVERGQPVPTEAQRAFLPEPDPDFDASFDIEGEEMWEDGAEFLCLYVTSIQQALDCCLLLAPVEGEGEVYRRVGIATHYQANPSTYVAAEERIIHLV